MITLLTTQDLQDFKTDKPFIVIDFYADWCAPCKMMGPIFESLASEFSNVEFVKVNIEGSPLHKEYGVRSIPAFVITTELMDAGKTLDSIFGARDINALREFIQQTTGN